MTITYKTNSAKTTKTLTEWFFGKAYVKSMTEKALREAEKSGTAEIRVFQAGTGFLTITIK